MSTVLNIVVILMLGNVRASFKMPKPRTLAADSRSFSLFKHSSPQNNPLTRSFCANANVIRYIATSDTSQFLKLQRSSIGKLRPSGCGGALEQIHIVARHFQIVIVVALQLRGPRRLQWSWCRTLRFHFDEVFRVHESW